MAEEELKARVEALERSERLAFRQMRDAVQAKDALHADIAAYRERLTEISAQHKAEWEARLRLEADLANAQTVIAAQADELTDWALVADGVKHDWRCDPPDHPCLRCQVEALTAERNEAREAAQRHATHVAVAQEQRTRAEQAETALAAVTALAYVGDHHFPDLTYKARLEELVPQHRALEQQLAAMTAERDELKALYEAGCASWNPVYEIQATKLCEAEARATAAEAAAREAIDRDGSRDQ